ncbi:hypothetical protein LSH36_119g08028 [Paralvinella palmiformis]|uniref:Uncharacterized protein n=1 Tax=Paralvinella palmiformis TaxID=53620 RepID=A0AAD9NAQ8_9ANNE|nr:hypothetical protein LSH36_119g08028 [Paralvinella palmiformis]
MAQVNVFRFLILTLTLWISHNKGDTRVADHGPSYDVNHTTLGCPDTLPCLCHISYENGDPEKVINCTARNLQELPSFMALIGHPFDRLLLNGNKIRAIHKNAFKGLEVRILELSNNSIVSISDKGFMDIEGIEELYMDNSKLPSTPISLHFLKELRTLSMRYCDIRQLTKAAFQELTNLEVLDLTGNPLHLSLPFDAFDTLERLRVLKLADCELTNLPRDVLAHVTNLEHLILKNNNITELQPKLFEELPKLKELDLEGNAVVLESFKQFEILQHLKVLKLGHCHISAVNSHLVRHIPHIHTLVLKHCHIQKIVHGAFRNLFHLTKLDISGNPKVKVTDRLFHGLEDRLKFVGIENMNLSSFPTSAFRKLFLLKKVKATRNVIRSLPKGIFRGLRARHTEVHLEKNEISEIEEGVFSGIRPPMKLYLQHNNISSLAFLAKDPCDFYESELSLEENPVRCDCEAAAILQMKAFTIRGKCQTGDAIFRDLSLAPPFKKILEPGVDYFVTAAGDHCLELDRNRTHERYSCACEEWLPLNGTKTCSGEEGLEPAQRLMYLWLIVATFLLTII